MRSTNQYEDLEDTDNIVNSTFAIVGGKASFKALMDWAAQNLNKCSTLNKY